MAELDGLSNIGEIAIRQRHVTGYWLEVLDHELFCADVRCGGSVLAQTEEKGSLAPTTAAFTHSME
jgi:hypothetical protein